jgi:hypothetical protein
MQPNALGVMVFKKENVRGQLSSVVYAHCNPHS